MVLLQGVVVLLVIRYCTALMMNRETQPCWSQVQQSSPSFHGAVEVPPVMTDLRVGQSTKHCPGAHRAKPCGGMNFNISSARKRAFRRARQRAAVHGQTVYRGRLHSAASLQALTVRRAASPTREQPAPGTQTRRAPETRRLRVQTWNMGGCSSDAYDVLCEWLERQQDLGVLLLQETHWGLGHAEGQWCTNGWTWFSSPDPARRYAGVAIVVSHRLAPATACTFCTWVPGRILQVRVECAQLNLDLVTVYQWVREVSYSAERQEQRTQIWHQLGRVVHSIPKRNLLVVGGDFNAGLQAHSNLIGKGLLPGSADRVDPELQDLIEATQLCVLNTWGSSRPAKCATFCNGQQRSQIDYLMVRKHAADHVARSACPDTEDLTPWRQGPKHRKLGCSIPQLAGWRLDMQGSSKLIPARYSQEDLRWHRQHRTERFAAFQMQVQRVAENALPSMPIAKLNQTLLSLCAAHFPRKPVAVIRPGGTPEVRTGIGQMWALHRALRARRPGTSFLQIMAAWKRYHRFMRAWREVRQRGRAAPRARIELLVQRASDAAARHDMREVYMVVRRLAPKRKYESLRIRSPTGNVLTQREQFDAIYQYFSTVFQRQDAFQHTTQHTAVAFSAAEVEQAITALKSCKAVPSGSPIAEIWQISPGPFSKYLTQHLQYCRMKRQPLPAETTDCQLALLPKPGRPSRRPCDLRPLGLQDPSSKILACTLRDKIAPFVVPWLSDKPQFAYVPGRSIDEAILRVCHKCCTGRRTGYRLAATLLHLHTVPLCRRGYWARLFIRLHSVRASWYARRGNQLPLKHPLAAIWSKEATLTWL